MELNAQRTQLAQLVAQEFSRLLGRSVRPEYLEQVILIRDGFCWGWSYRFGDLVATYICEENTLHVSQEPKQPGAVPLVRKLKAA